MASIGKGKMASIGKGMLLYIVAATPLTRYFFQKTATWHPLHLRQQLQLFQTFAIARPRQKGQTVPKILNTLALRFFAWPQLTPGEAPDMGHVEHQMAGIRMTASHPT
jgi:hypothetical protein